MQQMVLPDLVPLCRSQELIRLSLLHTLETHYHDRFGPRVSLFRSSNYDGRLHHGTQLVGSDRCRTASVELDNPEDAASGGIRQRNAGN